MVVVVMGVSGCGKSTVGARLAHRLGWEFRDGDSFHPPENVAKMKAGFALTDEDRWPWLDAIRACLDDICRRGESAVVACSALKAQYRQRLAGGLADTVFVHLYGPPELIAARMAARSDHFMPPTLLASQLATLEPPTDALTVNIDRSPDVIVEEILVRLKLVPSS